MLLGRRWGRRSGEILPASANTRRPVARWGRKMTGFRVLGEFEMCSGDRVCAITAPKPRQVLALMALSANQLVHHELLIDELWDREPPKSAVPTVQTYIYQLRKIIAREG